MKTIFFCGHQSPYGLAHLEPLLKSKFTIIAVVLASDKRWKIFREKLVGRRFIPISNSSRTFPKIKSLLKYFLRSLLSFQNNKAKEFQKTLDLVQSYKIPVWLSDDVNESGFLAKAINAKAEIFVSAAYPQIFSKELLSIPANGSINFHPSLLPKFRGAHPHYWAIAKGETISGITAHYMTERIDDGDIIAQRSFPIQELTYKQLYEKILNETPLLVKQVESFLLDKQGKLIKQEPLQASYFRNDREIHHRIFWNIQSTQDIHNLIRAGYAFCSFRNHRLGLQTSSVSAENRNLTNDILVENGTIIDICQNYIAIKTSNGIVHISVFDIFGKSMSALDFIIEFKPFIGEKLE
jgi:methionyl-tRNA formyltransferase